MLLSLIAGQTIQEDQNERWHWQKSFFLQSQTSCSWAVPFFSRFFSVLERWFWSLLIRRRSKLKTSSTKWQSSWRIVELNTRTILSLQDDMICPSVMIICSDSWIFCLLIWTPLSLSHSPRHKSRRRSLLMLMLSHSDSHTTSQGYMAWCGCHEILISCSTTVLFSTTFLLISISRVEGDGKFI